MTPGSPVLLDTVAVSNLIRGSAADEPLQVFVAGRDLLVSFVTVGELLFGAHKAKWGFDRVAALEVRLATLGVVPGTIGVARTYARLRTEFGTSKGANDLWIAACAAAAKPDPVTAGHGRQRLR
jgi:predicted nucleic acid-binding protein